MAINKNAYLRYQILDNCFRNPGRTYTIDDLLEEINNRLFERDPNNNGIQRRQLFEDIKYMESEDGFSIPLDKIKDGRKKIYRYSEKGFSIRNEPINEAEALQMQSAVQILSRFSGAPQFEWMDEMLPRLESKFGAIPESERIISYESNIDYVGTEYIKVIFNAIHNQRVLNVFYHPFTQQKAINFIFHPYHVKQYNNRWFVFGRNEENGIETWNLALDRVNKIKETDRKYNPTKIDWEDYFSDIVGVSRPFDAVAEEVKLLFTVEAKPYILTKPIHQSQKVREINDQLEVRIKVIPNFELQKLILSFGWQVTVITPESLRDKIASILKQAVGNY